MPRSECQQSRLDHAIRLHQGGSLGAATTIYRDILSAEPDDHECLHLLGLAAHQNGDATGAVATIARAVALEPNAAHYHNNYGQTLRRLGRLEEAEASLARARALRPASAEIASNLGSILADLLRWPEAIAVLREAVTLAPELADAHYNLGLALGRSGDPRAAIPAYEACLRLRPAFADAHFNLGHALAATASTRDAADSYRRAILADPDHADAHNNLGVLLHQADRLDEAETAFAAALRLRPDDAGFACNLGAALLSTGRIDEAAACLGRVLAADPDHGVARLGQLAAHLPIIAADGEEIAARRQAYADALAVLEADADRPLLRKSLAAAIGSHPPFFLAYQGQDDRALQERLGGLLHALAEPPAPGPPPPRHGERVRVGVVSGFFREHTVWTLFLHGWLSQLDPERFELIGFHTGVRRDRLTAAAAGYCARFHADPRPFDAWRLAVRAEAPHVLLYPEVGMDPTSAHLAAHRLAPVQCAAWGHPVTTGLPSIDYFLSGAMMETAGSAAHYREQLVALPHLGVFVEPPHQTPSRRDRASFGLRPGCVAYWSGQNLPKYHPDWDEVFPRIAAAVPGAQFVFTAFGRGTHVTRLFTARLARAFDRYGLDAATHCVILPPLDQADFLAAAAHCDVILDTIGWSGGKSTLDCLSLGPPIVTMAGRFLRGRHTAAILERAGVPEAVTTTPEAYLDLAIRLGREPALRHEMRTSLARGAPRVWRDRSVIAALEAFLDRAARER